MKRILPFKGVLKLAVMGCFCSIVAGTVARAADDTLTLTFTTTAAGGEYQPRNCHVVYLTDSANHFITTVGNGAGTMRAIWANARANHVRQWYTSNPDTAGDIDARTSATRSNHSTYNITWNWKKRDGTSVPDGAYRIKFELTDDNYSQNKFHRTEFAITKGRTPWTVGPVSQNGYNNVTLTYTPAVAPTIELSPGSLDFGPCDVGTSTDLIFAILNRGSTPLGITALAISGSDAGMYSLVSPPALPFNVPAAGRVPGRVNITVRFSPGAVGTFDKAQVDVGSGGLPPVSKVTLSGQGVPPTPPQPSISVSPGELPFGLLAVGGHSELTFDIESTGEGVLQITSIEIAGLDKAAYRLVSPPAVPFDLPARTGVQTITVRFSPASSRGYDYAQVAAGNNDPNKPVALVSLSGEGIASPPGSLLVSGSVGANAHAVAMSNQHAIVGQGATLTILDASDPCNPTRVGQVRLADVIQGVAVLGDTAYAAGGSSGLLPVAIDDPSSPVALAASDTPGFAYDAAASGTTLCVADGPGGLAIYDISDPNDPALRSTYQTQGSATAVALSGTTAYILDNQLGLQIVEVAGATPVLLGSCNEIELGRAIALSGTLACVTDSLGNFFVVDITHTDTPTLRGQARLAGQGSSICVMSLEGSSVAYVASGQAGIEGVLLSDPDMPSYLGVHNTPGQAYDLAVAGSNIHLADGSAGFEILNVTDASAPMTKLGDYRLQSTPFAAAANTLTYIAAGDSGLHTMDLSSPASPALVSILDTMLEADIYRDNIVDFVDFSLLANDWLAAGGLLAGDIYRDNTVNPLDMAKLAANWLRTEAFDEARSIVVSGTTAYLANGRSGFQIVDVSNPSAPYALSDYPTQSPACAVAVDGSVAVAAAGTSVYVIDISNSSALSLIGQWASDGWAFAVAIDSTNGYVANGSRGLQVLNLADASPAGAYDTPGVAFAVAVSNNVAYVADGPAGVQILDVSTPATPTPISAFDTGSNAMGVTIAGSRLYVADGSGICVVEVSNPAAPALYARSLAPVRSLSTVISGPQIIVSDNRGGLLILGVQE
jgi:hypothetical protein